MNFKENRKALFGNTLVKNFEKRNFESYYCATKEEASDKALSLIKDGSTVTWGGTMSFSESGLKDKLFKGNYKIIDRATYKNKNDAYIEAFSADTYIMSANGVSATGELVNIDGTGNRLAALCFGPKQVIVLVSLNKVMPTLNEAVSRARNVSAPINTQRFDLKTPCRVTGVCGNCTSDDCICAQILVTRMCRPKGRIKIIFCGEDLGY